MTSLIQRYQKKNVLYTAVKLGCVLKINRFYIIMAFDVAYQGCSFCTNMPRPTSNDKMNFYLYILPLLAITTKILKKYKKNSCHGQSLR